MDFALKPFADTNEVNIVFVVSILVLMDFALKLGSIETKTPRQLVVSILVLMDFALKPRNGNDTISWYTWFQSLF